MLYQLIIVSAALLLFFATIHVNHYWGNMLKRSGLSENAGSESHVANRITSGRVDMWKSAYQLFEKSPLVGAGPDSYRYDDVKAYGEHAHSIVFQYLAEWGIFGSALFYLLLLSILWPALKQLMRSKKYETELLICLVPLTSLLMLSLTSGVFYVAQSLVVCCIFSAMVCVSVSLRTNNN